MNAGGIPVIKFLFREPFKVLDEALSLREVYGIEEFESANDLVTYLSSLSAGLVIISLRDKNDLVQIATFMKSLKKIAKDTATKVVIINFSGERIFENAIAKLGIQDTIEVSINTKALKFKIDFWMKSLKGQIKTVPATPKEKLPKVQESNFTNDKPGNFAAPQWQEPLKLEDDIWIIKSENDCKRILSKWLVRLLGPGPNVGQWVEVKRGIWRFDIRPEEKELYMSGEGSWFFAGDQKPEFIWKESTWMITGLAFELYYKDASGTFSRLKSRNKILEIANNSVYAKTKEGLIIESFNKEIVFKKEAQRLDDLEGEGKTEKLDHDPLSGEVDFLEKKLGNLSGECEGEDPSSKFWGGKLSGNAQQKGQRGPSELSGKTEGTDPESKYWGGKISENAGSEAQSNFWKGRLSSSAAKPSPDENGEDGEALVDPAKFDGAFRKGQRRDTAKAPDTVAPFLTLAQEKELSELTEDASVVSYLVVSGKKINCKLDDFFDNLAIFHTDDKTIKIPQDLTLDLLYESLSQNSELKISGNVVTVESDGEGDQYVTVELTETQIEELQKFMDNFERRQQNINEFMKRVKGH